MIFFKKLREELASQESIMKYRADMAEYARINNCKTQAIESDFMTLYHLTPFDLGKEVKLEIRKTLGIESYFIVSNMTDKCRDFKCISFADTISHCFIRLPAEKLENYMTFYIYRTKMPVKGWHDVFDLGDNHFFHNREYRLFKNTDCIRVGRLELLENGFDIVDKCENMLDPIKDIGEKIMLYKENKTTILKV